MKPWFFVLFAAYGLLPIAQAAAEDAAPPQRPIRALLVTGGCCHDYDRQKLIIPRGVSARADVEWTVVQQGGTTTNTKIPLYDDPHWAEGYDVVVHNECFAGVNDREFIQRILKPHREGLPAVVVHCAMHSYRDGQNEWFKFCGVRSHNHGPHYVYTVENLALEHPIMKTFGDTWTVPKGELYNVEQLMPTAQPLAHAKRREDNQPQVCIWTNQYGEGRVFGTTIGHYNETMAEPVYLDMLTRGLLWATGRLEGHDIRQTDEVTDASIKALVAAPKADEAPTTNCCGEGNLALSKPTKASSEETNKNNFSKHAVDGDLDTRWCASGPRTGEWLQIDLGGPQQVKSLRIHWESKGTYRYRVEASADGGAWKTVVDAAENKQSGGVYGHELDAPGTRFLRVHFLGAQTGAWGSIREVEVYDGPLPELPVGVTSNSFSKDVQVPDGFRATLFGPPPAVNYPVCLTAAPTGEVFVGVDEQGSLGKEPGRGKILRCIDTDGDGVADRITEFCQVDHPRGLIYDNGTLWVLHPPNLSVYYDDDRDGVADRQETLISGISTPELNKQRGADHTTNGIRLGIDGWIYIAVGDYGFTEARGADGTVLSRRGGGVVRVRPDGSEMEIYCWGLRNILDACIDPYLNIFARDNTNDGGGWNVRVSHLMQSAEYGYPSLYINFSDEIMPPLADYGGGSGCGGMYLHDLRWPGAFGDAAYTCDWGRSEVYRHNFPANGATFDPHQETFVKIPRPTDIDVDGSGRMYISSWKDGGFNFSHPNVGFVAQVTPKDFVPKPFPYLDEASDEKLVDYLTSESAVYRQHSQLELLRRGRQAQRSARLVQLAQDAQAPLYGRVAAIFTLKQLDGAAANAALVKLAADDTVREFAIKALTDRKTQLEGVPVKLLIEALGDANPRVRAQAAVSLGRLGQRDAAAALLPLAQRSTGVPLPTEEPLHAQADPERVIPHLAVQALVALEAVEPCLAALDGPQRAAALRALSYLHRDEVASGLIDKLKTTQDQSLRNALLTTLVRLYHREGDYKSGWWGTRPDTSGPYFDRATWSASEKIAETLRATAKAGDGELRKFLGAELTRHHVKLEGIDLSMPAGEMPQEEMQAPLALPEVDPNNQQLIANMPIEQAVERAMKAPGDAARGKLLFTQQACHACHTDAEGQDPKGPHLVDIGQRYQRSELIESILKPSAKIAQGFDTYSFITADGKVLSGFVVLESATEIRIRENNGVAHTLKIDEIDQRMKQTQSMMPDGIVNNLTPEQLADLLAYLESLKK